MLPELEPQLEREWPVWAALRPAAAPSPFGSAAAWITESLKRAVSFSALLFRGLIRRRVCIRDRPRILDQIRIRNPHDVLGGHFLIVIQFSEHAAPIAVIGLIETELLRKPRVAIQLPDQRCPELRLFP